MEGLCFDTTTKEEHSFNFFPTLDSLQMLATYRNASGNMFGSKKNDNDVICREATCHSILR